MMVIDDAVTGSGSSGKKILSVEDCEYILRELKYFNRIINDQCERVQTGLKKFNANAIVQSFYASGNYGREKQERVEKVIGAIKRYLDVLNDWNGLIPQTEKIIQDQQELLNRGA